MARLSMNEMTTYRWAFEEDVAHYAAAGIDAVGVWRRKLADYGEDQAVDLLAGSPLKVSNLLWAGGFTGSDGRTFRESVDDALDAVRLAAAIRADCLVVYSGARAGHTHNHARRLVRTALLEVLPLAEELEVTLALEPMHSAVAGDWTFLTGVEETLALLDDVGSPRLRLVFDTYHLGHDLGLVDSIERFVGRIGVVHLGDGDGPPLQEQNRTRLGDGTIPLKEIVHALLACGYDGYFDVELMGEEIEAADYHELLAHSKARFQELLAPSPTC